MTRVDLITGFLGAGKTTFIHGYLKHLRGSRVRVIENEFGSIGVDAALLRDADCDIDDLSGVCMCCQGKGRFEAMLADAAAQGYDRVVVEPSGIYDVDEFFSAMDAPAVKKCCRTGSVLAIVDVGAREALSGESAYLMYSQLMAAGKVVLSKTQLHPAEAVEDTVNWINALIDAQGGGRRFEPSEVCARDWDALTAADYAALAESGFNRDGHPRRISNHDALYDSALVAGYCRDAEEMAQKLDALMTDPRFGRVIRAKGYLRDYQKRRYEINCTRAERSIRPAPDVKRGVLVVVGQALDEDALGALFAKAPDAR